MAMQSAFRFVSVVAAALAAAAGVGLATAGSGPAGAGPPPAAAEGQGRGRPGLLAAAVGRGIWLIDPETGAARSLVESGSNPRLSPDGAQVSFDRDRGAWRCATRPGSEPVRIPGLVLPPAAWSPDGKSVVHSKPIEGPKDDGRPPIRTETWVADADGKNPRKLPVPEGDEVNDWSRDGRWLVTVSSRDYGVGVGLQVYAMHPDGTGQTRLTEGRGSNIWPRISPDGTRVVYSHQEPDKPASLWVVGIDGKGARRVFQEEEAFPRACWSPDGRRLAVVIAPEGNAGGHRIEIMAADGGDRRKLALPADGHVNNLDWR